MRLAAIMRNPGADEPSSTSVSAAALILGYGHGKPAQTISGDDEQPIQIVIRKMLTEGRDD